MNTIQRGAETERKAIKNLENLGWRIMFRAVRTRWQSVDFDNKWDLVCIKYTHQGASDTAFRDWFFVQIKTNCSNKKKEIKRLKDWIGLNSLNDMKFQLWNYRTKWKKKGFEIIELSK